MPMVETMAKDEAHDELLEWMRQVSAKEEYVAKERLSEREREYMEKLDREFEETIAGVKSGEIKVYDDVRDLIRSLPTKEGAKALIERWIDKDTDEFLKEFEDEE